MDISEFAVRLLLIFFPGIIATMVIDLLTSHQKRELHSFFLNAFVLGLASYFIHYISIQLGNYFFGLKYKVHFLDFLVDSKTKIVWNEIVWSSVAAFFLGIVVTLAMNYRWLHTIARKVKITRQFPEADVWGFVFNSKDAKWVLIRDHNKGEMYEGWVEAFSDTHKDNELLVRDVSVYNMENGKKLYEVSAMYISKTTENLVLEFRYMKG